MKIHALQTGTVRCKQFQLTGAASNLHRFWELAFTDKWGPWMPIYCWLIEHPDGLILVDTGETNDIHKPGYLPSGGLYHKAVETRITEADELPVQLNRIGYSPEQIQTVIFTHLHGDHTGGLPHFPHARILVSKAEFDFAKGLLGSSFGYFKRNWPDWFQPELIQYSGGPEGVFQRSKTLTEDGRIVAVPTPGHNKGHQSILISICINSFSNLEAKYAMVAVPWYSPKVLSILRLKCLPLTQSWLLKVISESPQVRSGLTFWSLNPALTS